MGHEVASDVQTDYGNHGLVALMTTRQGSSSFGHRRLLGAVLAVALMTSAASAGTPETAPAGVSLQKEGHGWRLANTKGMTLGMSSLVNNDPEKSACNNACARNLAAACSRRRRRKLRAIGSKSRATMARCVRPYLGKPLYAYSQDVVAGDTNGDEVNKVWSIAFKQIPMPSGLHHRARRWSAMCWPIKRK